MNLNPIEERIYLDLILDLFFDLYIDISTQKDLLLTQLFYG